MAVEATKVGNYAETVANAEDQAALHQLGPPGRSIVYAFAEVSRR